MSKVTAKKRIIIAAALFGVFIIGALVSIVLVLAAQTQNVKTSISISYVVDGVGADVGFRYAMIPTDTATDQTITPISQVTNEFGVSEATKTQDLGGIEEGTLAFSSESRQIVFEYYFKNTAESAFSISLTKSPYLGSEESGALNLTTNMEERYYVSAEPLSEEQWGEKLINEGKSTENFAPQALTEEGSDIYIYVSANVENPNKGANYEGEFIWVLNQQDTIEITLNDNGTERTLKVIPDSAVSGIMLPCIKVPEIDDGSAYLGYFAEANSTTDPYIDINGTGIKAASEVTATTMLYSNWAAGMTIDGSTLIAVEDSGLVTDGENKILYIPEGVTIVGNGLNPVSTTATEVVVPKGVSLANNAFSGNTTIKKVMLGEIVENTAYADNFNVIDIGVWAFSACSNLTEIIFGEGITEVGYGMFDSCQKLETVHISASITKINSFAFSNCTNLKTITIDENSNLKTIEASAFAGNSSLESIELPDEMEYIGGAVFAMNAALKEINIPEGIEVIESQTFYGCTSLLSMKLPTTLKLIEDGAVTGVSVNEIYVDNIDTWWNLKLENEGNSHPFMWGFGHGKIYVDDELLTSVVVPAEVTDLSSKLGWLQDLTSITFEENSQLTRIGAFGFIYCKNITSLNIPSKVTSIGMYAFNGCEKLTTINFEGTRAQWNAIAGLSEASIPEGCTINCSDGAIVSASPLSYFTLNGTTITGLTDEGKAASEIIIPLTVNTIADQAFKDWNGTKVTISSSVKVIGSAAFHNCPNLTTVTFEENDLIAELGFNPFIQCQNLSEINWNVKKVGMTLNSAMDIFCGIGMNTDGVIVNIGENVEELPAYLFYEAYSGTSKFSQINLPENSTWVYSETKGATTGTAVNVDAATLARNITDTAGIWHTYYLIRTDN